MQKDDYSARGSWRRLQVVLWWHMRKILMTRMVRGICKYIRLVWILLRENPEIQLVGRRSKRNNSKCLT